MAVLMGIVPMIFVGCDLSTRHTVLTFFFTGVPTLEEMEKQKKEEKEKKVKVCQAEGIDERPLKNAN